MTPRSIKGYRNTYLDSVKLLVGSRAILETDGIEWGTVISATPANLDMLVGEGFDELELAQYDADDLIMVAKGDSIADAFERADAAMFASGELQSSATAVLYRSLDEVTDLRPAPNLAIISVGGDYAALEAHKALSAGMHVLLFSDNVALDAEVELKRRAASMSLLVMGPGAGTAMLDGVGLGFANAVRRGTVGVVAAAGTGAQEVMTLIHRAGLGVSDVVGVGGRDLSDSVGGLMTTEALRSLESDDMTEVILLVSKPPSTKVAREILARPASKPIVAALIGLRDTIDVPEHVTLAATLEDGVRQVVHSAGGTLPWEFASSATSAREAMRSMSSGRVAIRGLFSGGTLCFEALTLMAQQGLRVHSNTPLSPDLSIASAGEASHICLDLGEEEYTRGRPHPMIDPAARINLILDHGHRPETAVVLLDVVLGYGSHPDPAGALAEACANVSSIENGPQVVAYLLGTDIDPQDVVRQRQILEDAGCIVAPTNARAAMMAAAIASRNPSISDS
jgi:FdrA protein